MKNERRITGVTDYQLTNGLTPAHSVYSEKSLIELSCGHAWWMKSSVCTSASAGQGVHCKCFLACPVWLLNGLNQSCRWSDLTLARLWCETISPGPWGPPTVKPTAFYSTLWMQQVSVFIPQITRVLSWEDWSFSSRSRWLSAGLNAALL